MASSEACLGFPLVRVAMLCLLLPSLTSDLSFFHLTTWTEGHRPPPAALLQPLEVLHSGPGAPQ